MYGHFCSFLDFFGHKLDILAYYIELQIAENMQFNGTNRMVLFGFIQKYSYLGIRFLAIT